MQTPNSLITNVMGGLLIVSLAISVTTLHLRGLTVADARLEHILEPQQFLSRHLQIWDDSRGPGTPAVYFSPVLPILQTLLQHLGFAPWLIGRLTLALYLSLAGIGTMRLASRLGPERRWFPIISGMLFAFSPFTSQFLIPSGLFVSAAVLPWLLIIALDGLSGDSPWRAGARIALVIGAVGLLNTASLLYALVPVGLFVVSVLVVERGARWLSALRFALTAFGLTLLVSLAMLTVLVASLGTINRNLATTELPSTIARTSTASESWRGLGLWLSYLRLGRTFRPGAELFFTNPVIITLTFATPLLAILGVVARKVSLWKTWGLLMVLGLVVMVGSNQVASTPASSLARWVLEEVPVALAFRSTYKAGAAVTLAFAILAPSGALAVSQSISTKLSRVHNRLGSWITTSLIFCACSAGIIPFAIGGVFTEEDTFRQIPEYWEEAFKTLETVPNDRVLVLPGASRYRYSWGYVNDNLFDAKLKPAALFAQTISGATPPMTRVIEELDARISADQLDPESIGRMMSAIGARWLLVQNDVIGFDFDFPERLRAVDDLTLVASFGNVSIGRPSLELYRLADDLDPLDATWRSAPPLIVSGGEGVLSVLAREGWLERGIVNLSTLTDKQRSLLLAGGAEILVADGSQRRAVKLGIRKSESIVLDSSVRSSRPVMTSKPDDPDTQTVLDVENLTIEIENDSATDLIWEPSEQPALMLDGKVITAWQVSQSNGSAVGRSAKFKLDDPTLIESVEVTQSNAADGKINLLVVTIVEDNGVRTDIPVQLESTGPTVVTIGRRITELKLTIASSSTGPGPVGISEIEFVTAGGNLESTASLRLPIEVSALSEASSPPISYLFSSLPTREEAFLQRKFVTVRDQSFLLRGRLQSLRPVGIKNNICREIFLIDGSPVPVRPIKGTSWAATTVDFESCDTLDLKAGEHLLVESASYIRTVSSITLIDTKGSFVTSYPSRDKSIDDNRLSPSEHEYSIPQSGGYLSTTIPFHPKWDLEIDGRNVVQFDSFAGTLWAVAPGDATVVRASFGQQRPYRAALAVSSVSTFVCLVLAIRWRRR